MNRLIAFIIFIMTFISGFAQLDTIQGKAYRNVEDMKADKPFLESTFVFKRKLNKMAYGSYRLLHNQDGIDYYDFEYSAWIISDGKYLYLNATRHALKGKFFKFEKHGNFYYFQSIPIMSISQQQNLQNSQIMFGLVGAAVSASNSYAKNKKYLHHVLDLNKGTTNVLSAAYVENILKEYPKLYEEFMSFNDKNDINVLRMFIDKINEMQ